MRFGRPALGSRPDRVLERMLRWRRRCEVCGCRGHIRCHTFVFDPPIVLRGRPRRD